jgi:hypothetical protein
VGYVPLSLGGAYPGLYLFTSPARFVRPVKNLDSLPDGEPSIELIGPFEQVSFGQLLHPCIYLPLILQELIFHCALGIYGDKMSRWWESRERKIVSCNS